MSQKSSESELSKSASAKGTDSKVDATAEVQHRTTETLKSEEKSVGKCPVGSEEWCVIAVSIQGERRREGSGRGRREEA